MYQRRIQTDIKPTNGSTVPSSPITSQTSNPGGTSTTCPVPSRVSIYCMRDRVILNKMTNIMSKLAPDTETEVTSRLHQEIPAVKIDGYLTYSLYVAFQNLIHLNSIYLFLYYAVFWLGSTTFKADTIRSVITLEKTLYEETQFIELFHPKYENLSASVHTKYIESKIYFTLVALSVFEVITAFLWTINRKLPLLIPRHAEIRCYIGKFLIMSIVIICTSLIAWTLYQTIVTKKFSQLMGFAIIGHVIILFILDKPNLFEENPHRSSKSYLATRQINRNSTSSSSTSSINTNALGRHPNRSLSSIQNRKINMLIQSSSSSLLSSSLPISSNSSWSRWSSVMEDRIPIHQCSAIYAQVREEADKIWPIIIRRLTIIIYRTISSCYLFDVIPIQTLDPHQRIPDVKFLITLISMFSLSSLLSQTNFLFPVKLQTTLHRISTHLGYWRTQPLLRPETIQEWSSECNSYTRGSVVKVSSNRQEYFLAVQHLNNAAHPQSISHAVLYRVFGDFTAFSTCQSILSIGLLFINIIWVVCGKYWPNSIVGGLIILSNSYPTFKILRDRLIMDFVEEQGSFQTSKISKEKKLS